MGYGLGVMLILFLLTISQTVRMFSIIREASGLEMEWIPIEL
jgi:hypothetical protein